ncbi:MAG: hypothetical protein CHACPFDD_03883 [Phycisphaerae bacterium]|nr:hypothetical protein [Phycisphaerae bacterium]
MEEMLRHLPRRELGAAAEAKLLSRLRRARPRRRVRMSVWQAAACVVLSFAGGVASAPALRRAVPAPAGPSAAPAAAPVIVAVDASLFGSPPTNELSAARWTVLSTRGDE